MMRSDAVVSARTGGLGVTVAASGLPIGRQRLSLPFNLRVRGTTTLMTGRRCRSTTVPCFYGGSAGRSANAARVTARTDRGRGSELSLGLRHVGGGRRQEPPLRQPGRAIDITARIEPRQVLAGLISKYRRAA